MGISLPIWIQQLLSPKFGLSESLLSSSPSPNEKWFHFLADLGKKTNSENEMTHCDLFWLLST